MLIYLLLLLQLLIECISLGLGYIEFLLCGFQLFFPLYLSILHLLLQHCVLFLSSFVHILGDAQSLLTVLCNRNTTIRIFLKNYTKVNYG